MAGRVKAMNNDIMENVDAIHNAISLNLKISFQYFQWNVKKQPYGCLCQEDVQHV